MIAHGMPRASQKHQVPHESSGHQHFFGSWPPIGAEVEYKILGEMARFLRILRGMAGSTEGQGS